RSLMFLSRCRSTLGEGALPLSRRKPIRSLGTIQCKREAKTVGIGGNSMIARLSCPARQECLAHPAGVLDFLIMGVRAPWPRLRVAIPPKELGIAHLRNPPRPH